MLTRSLLLASISLALAMEAAAQCEGKTVGAAEWIHPEAVGRCPEGDEEQPLAHATATFQDQRVATGERGAGDFSFYNFSRLLVGPGCMVTLDHVYYDEDRDHEVKDFSVYDADRCLMKADNSLAERPEIILLNAPLAEIQIIGAAAYVYYAPADEQPGGGGRAELPPARTLIPAGYLNTGGGAAGNYGLLLAAAEGARRSPPLETAQAAAALAQEYELLVVKLSEVGAIVVEAAGERRQILRAEFMVWRSPGSARLEGPEQVPAETLALLNARLEGVVATGERPAWQGEYILGDLPLQRRDPPLLQRPSCLETNDCMEWTRDFEIEPPDGGPDIREPPDPLEDPRPEFTTTPEVFPDFDFGGCIETAMTIC